MKKTKKVIKKSKNKPVRLKDIPVTQGMLSRVRDELKHGITSIELKMNARFKEVDARVSEMDARFNKMDAKIDNLASKVEDLTSVVHRVALTVEGQNNNSNQAPFIL